MIREYNLYIWLGAFCVNFISVVMSVAAADQMRNVILKYNKPTFTQLLPSLVTTGIIYGAVSIWSVYTLGFVAMTLKDDEGNVVPIRFNIVMCLIGMLVSTVSATIGLFINCQDKLYAKSRAEILEYFVASISVEEMLNYSEYQVLILLITKELRYIIGGGLFMSFGTIGVLFTVIASMEFPGYIVWNGGILFGAIIIIFPALVGGSWVFFRLFSVYHDFEFLRLALIMFGSISICAMLYFASLAAEFRIDYNRSSAQPWSTGSVDKEDLLYPLLIAGTMCAWLLVMSFFADMRRKINSYRNHLQKLCPNEELSDILKAAENLLEKRNGSSREGGVKRNAVVPSDDESPL